MRTTETTATYPGLTHAERILNVLRAERDAAAREVSQRLHAMRESPDAWRVQAYRIAVSVLADAEREVVRHERRHGF